jgi:hypothetical protein
LAIAVLGVLLARTFDARVRGALNRLQLSASARAAIDRELPKMAGADVDTIPLLDPTQRAAARNAIATAFVSAFRLVFTVAAALALVAASAGLFLRDPGRVAK